MEKEKVELIKIIDEGDFQIAIIKRSPDKYKDISLLYEELAQLLYDRAKNRI